ncbi:hypothetical protein BMS3Bbin11_01463 [bacterium BMS3Bbin11]|nr:hypothetical protein BMS3Abin11_00706 [bacterium BMS3Abin11]GBE46363.1 hypothetical protein BMS3Bbin11_01463 [bacterium BMS3Bbin11]GMT39408.1 MAG: hypothetical protein IEMM0001_0143 [bacterium]HDH08204.1 hypothetical protein [Gammaproteobacteria bacterium]HDH16956.1 hypothetical protein [Gammaproteobacteria bacterium]
MKKILLAAFVTSVFAVSACASPGTSAKAPDDGWAKQVATAKAGIKALKKEDALWRDTHKFLKKAQKAYKAGDKKKANKLMKKVNSQIKLAGLQHESQKNATVHIPQ